MNQCITNFVKEFGVVITLPFLFLSPLIPCIFPFFHLILDTTYFTLMEFVWSKSDSTALDFGIA